MITVITELSVMRLKSAVYLAHDCDAMLNGSGLGMIDGMFKSSTALMIDTDVFVWLHVLCSLNNLRSDILSKDVFVTIFCIYIG